MPRDPADQARTIGRARDLRQESTFPERLLWSRLRREALGVHSRRQHPVGPFFADFCCVDQALVVELDGVTHNGRERHLEDAARTDIMNQHGFRVIRFTNDQVIANVDGVVRSIRTALAGGRDVGPTPVNARSGR